MTSLQNLDINGLILDISFSLAALLILLFIVWMAGRLLPRYGKSPLVLIAVTIIYMPFLAAAYLGFIIFKSDLQEQQNERVRQQHTELCAEKLLPTRERFIRAPKSAKTVWVKLHNLDSDAAERFAGAMMYELSNDAWLIDTVISKESDQLPVNALELLVKQIPARPENEELPGIIAMQVGLYENGDLIAERIDYINSSQTHSSCHSLVRPDQDGRYIGFISRAINGPLPKQQPTNHVGEPAINDTLPKPKDIDIGEKRSVEEIRKMPALSPMAQANVSFKYKSLQGMLPDYLPENIRIEVDSDRVLIKNSSGLLRIDQPYELMDVQMDGTNIVMITRHDWAYFSDYLLFVFDENGNVLQQARLALPPLPENQSYDYAGGPLQVSEQGIYFVMSPEYFRRDIANEPLVPTQWFLLERSWGDGKSE